MAAQHSFMCPLWESLTVGKTWAARCRPSSGKCWSFWTRRRRRSTAHSTSIRLPSDAQPPLDPSPRAKKMHLTTSSQTFLRYILKKKFLLGQNVTLSGLESALSLVFVLFVLLCLVLFFSMSPRCDEGLSACPKLIFSNLLSLQKNIRQQEFEFSNMCH